MFSPKNICPLSSRRLPWLSPAPPFLSLRPPTASACRQPGLAPSLPPRFPGHLRSLPLLWTSPSCCSLCPVGLAAVSGGAHWGQGWQEGGPIGGRGGGRVCLIPADSVPPGPGDAGCFCGGGRRQRLGASLHGGQASAGGAVGRPSCPIRVSAWRPCLPVREQEEEGREGRAGTGPFPAPSLFSSPFTKEGRNGRELSEGWGESRPMNS